MSADIVIVDLPMSLIDVASVINKFYNLIHDDALLEIVYNLDIDHDIYWSKQRRNLIAYSTRNCAVYNMFGGPCPTPHGLY